MACLLTKSAAVYRPRRALETDLHRVVRERWDEFRAVYAERLANLTNWARGEETAIELGTFGRDDGAGEN